MARRIDSRRQLVRLARELGVRSDWHEPDEQGVAVEVRGDNFDNTGFWGRIDGELVTFGSDRQEIWVEVLRDGYPVAEVNLATLFALAAGYEDES